MDNPQKQVLEFHQTFDCVINDKPTMPDIDTRILRMKLIEEEFGELAEAFALAQMKAGDEWLETENKPNLIGVADAIGDLLYVIYGTAVSCGIDMEPVMKEIHRSNMSKANPDGTVNRRPDGKVIKSSEYSPADLASVLRQQA